jgi:hypothetical protein
MKSSQNDAHADNWWTRHWATVTLFLFLAADGTGAGIVFDKSATALEHPDLWSVAVPGISTGAGTLALAAVTVWLARYQARRDQDARRSEAAARIEERQTAEDERALREARKVIATWSHGEDGTEDIQITNAGRETIVEVFLHEAVAEPPDLPGHKWEWTAKDLEGMIYQGRDNDWYRPYIAPGDTQHFAGWMSHMSGGRLSNAKVDDHKRFIEIEVAWTDPAGNHWKRRSYNEPQRTDVGYQPRPPLGLEDAEERVVSSGIRKAMDGDAS